MRLSQYAKQMGVSYKTAFRWWKAGKLDAYQLDTRTVIVREPAPHPEAGGVAFTPVFPQQTSKRMESSRCNASKIMQRLVAIR